MLDTLVVTPQEWIYLAHENGKQPSLFIVVLNWNSWHDTRECLESLTSSTYQNKTIIVVDSGSTDDSVALIRRDFPHLQILQLASNKGAAGGRNEGVRSALENGAEYIMLLDNDTIVDAGFVEPLVEALQSGCGVVSPLVYYESDRKHLWFAGSKIDWKTGMAYHTPTNIQDPGQFQGILEAAYLPTCCLVASATTWKQVGTFEPAYFIYWEDVDWSVRASAMGHRIGVVTTSRVWHKVSQAPTPHSVHLFLFVRNGLLFISRFVSGNRLPVYCRFIWESVLTPTLVELKHGRFSWKLAEARFSGVWSHITRKYGSPYR